MALDAVSNFTNVTVSTTYGSGDTSIVLSSGQGALLPAVSFNVVWYCSSLYSNPASDPNVEIVRVTNIATDTLTVTRAQEGTSASTKNSAGQTYKMLLSPTAKTITDIGTQMEYVSNKDTTTTLGTSDTKYPSQNAVKTYVDNSVPLYQEQLFSASGTWVCPRGITSIKVDMLGGGGAGGGYYDNSGNSAGGGGGGGGQALLNQVVTVVPMTSYTITLGAGGTAGSAGADGNAGGNTTAFSLTANGGGGGHHGAFQAGGAGGSAGDATAGSGGAGSYGGTGGNGNTGTGGGTGGTGGTSGGGGGGGAGGFAGIGGNGGTPGSGTVGKFGCGGGGSSYNTTIGSAGGAGMVIVKIPLITIT